MTQQVDVNRVPMEEVSREFDEAAKALPPTTPEALETAFDLIGDELVRQEALARDAGEDEQAARLMLAIKLLNMVDRAMKATILMNDFWRYAADLHDELAELPQPDPDDDDAWILKEDDKD